MPATVFSDRPSPDSGFRTSSRARLDNVQRVIVRLFRPAVPAVLLCATFLAGCSADTPDLTKVTHKRTTVPAQTKENSSSGASESEGTVEVPEGLADPAYAPDKLRQIDPCALLDNETLNAFGKPANPSPAGFSSCSNYMVDDDGEQLSITVELGLSALLEVDRANTQIDGVPAAERELSNGDACFVTLIVEGGAQPRGIVVQVVYEAGDPCKVGREVTEAVATRVRVDPPLRPAEAGSLATVDPCAILEPAAVADALGGQAEVRSTSLNSCTWDYEGVSLDLFFDVGTDPANRTYADYTPVDLEGVTVYQELNEEVYPSCEVRWIHRPVGQQAEVVRIELGNIRNKPDLDTCAKSTDLARSLLPKLPKA